MDWFTYLAMQKRLARLTAGGNPRVRRLNAHITPSKRCQHREDRFDNVVPHGRLSIQAIMYTHRCPLEAEHVGSHA